MQRSFTILLCHRQLWGIIFIALMNLAASLAAEETSPKGSLTGRVVGPDGKPVSGALVWADSDKNKPLAEARTDVEGRFHLDGLQPVFRDSHPIYIEADGYAIQYIPGKTFSIFPGIDTNLGDVRVDHGRVFTGQVLDVDGKPYHNAKVKYSVGVYSKGHSRGSIGPEQELTTDSEGLYRTPPLPVEELFVWTDVPERQLKWLSRPVQPGGEEVLEPLRLERDVPIFGTLKNEKGQPIVGVKINANAESKTTSDAEGKFTLHGFGPKPRFQLQVYKEGYVFINWSVKMEDDGLHWREVGDDSGKDHGPIKGLHLVLQPESWIEGQALDSETGEPVRLEKVILCQFERKANGEVVLSGCTAWGFQQPKDGFFRMPYSHPDEYHLTLSASGYEDAEAFTPKVTELKIIGGIVVKMKKKEADTTSDVSKQTISGIVTREGKPVKAGWVGLWRPGGSMNNINAYIMRGRTVVSDPILYQGVLLRDGNYSLSVPYQSNKWCVVVEEPNRPLTLVGPMKIELNEKKKLDIACSEGGGIQGRIKNVPPGWEGHLWVVAFTKDDIRMETRVDNNGAFSFSKMPPGEYGLKVGHDAYHDSEVPTGDFTKLPKEARESMNDPWQRAKRVDVKADIELSGLELELPQGQEKNH